MPQSLLMSFCLTVNLEEEIISEVIYLSCLLQKAVSNVTISFSSFHRNNISPVKSVGKLLTNDIIVDGLEMFEVISASHHSHPKFKLRFTCCARIDFVSVSLKLIYNVIIQAKSI